MKRYEWETEILSLLCAFESTTISRDAWKHAEDLTVALCYLSHHDLEIATKKMRSGIFKLLRSFGVDLRTEIPYHETLAGFWMRTVADFNASKNGPSLLDKVNEVVAKYDKDYPLRFYRTELLFSDEARAKFVENGLSLSKTSPSDTKRKEL